MKFYITNKKHIDTNDKCFLFCVEVYNRFPFIRKNRMQYLVLAPALFMANNDVARIRYIPYKTIEATRIIDKVVYAYTKNRRHKVRVFVEGLLLSGKQGIIAQKRQYHEIWQPLKPFQDLMCIASWSWQYTGPLQSYR